MKAKRYRETVSENDRLVIIIIIIIIIIIRAVAVSKRVLIVS
jgi:hypothetical protein